MLAAGALALLAGTPVAALSLRTKAHAPVEPHVLVVDVVAVDPPPPRRPAPPPPRATMGPPTIKYSEAELEDMVGGIIRPHAEVEAMRAKAKALTAELDAAKAKRKPMKAELHETKGNLKAVTDR